MLKLQRGGLCCSAQNTSQGASLPHLPLLLFLGGFLLTIIIQLTRTIANNAPDQQDLEHNLA